MNRVKNVIVGERALSAAPLPDNSTHKELTHKHKQKSHLLTFQELRQLVTNAVHGAVLQLRIQIFGQIFICHRDVTTCAIERDKTVLLRAWKKICSEGKNNSKQLLRRGSPKV